MQNNYKINEKPPVFAYNGDLQQKREKLPCQKIKRLKRILERFSLM